jgi:hypothetical protein
LPAGPSLLLYLFFFKYTSVAHLPCALVYLFLFIWILSKFSLTLKKVGGTLGGDKGAVSPNMKSLVRYRAKNWSCLEKKIVFDLLNQIV